VTLTYFFKVILLQAIFWEPFDLQSSYFAWGTKLVKSSMSFKVHHYRWPWPTFSRSFFSRLYLENRLTFQGPPWWVTLTYFFKVILLQAIFWEPFDLQSSYFAWGTRWGKSSMSIILGDLDLLYQGHSLAGYILRTVWPTGSIFSMGDQVRKLFKVHDEWPWPTFSRSLFSRLYLENRLTYRVHILHERPG
jgi:hypothetical protein